MTTELVATSDVVNVGNNCGVDISCRLSQDFLVDTLAKRLQWVIDSGRVKSARQWGLAAKLSHSAIATTISRGSAMTTETVKELARIAGVNESWLAFGTGGPDDVSSLGTESMPGTMREALFELARDRTFVSKGAIGRAQEQGANRDDWTVSDWTALLLRLTQQDMRQNPKVFQEMIRERTPQFRAKYGVDPKVKSRKKDPPAEAATPAPTKKRRAAG